MMISSSSFSSNVIYKCLSEGSENKPERTDSDELNMLFRRSMYSTLKRPLISEGKAFNWLLASLSTLRYFNFERSVIISSSDLSPHCSNDTSVALGYLFIISLTLSMVKMCYDENLSGVGN